MTTDLQSDDMTTPADDAPEPSPTTRVAGDDDGEKELLAGFADDDDVPTATPAPDVAAAPEPEVPAQPKIAQITEDEFAQLRQRAAKVDELEAEFRKRTDAAFGKLGDLQRQIKEAGTAALTDEDIAPFKDDFPEVAAVLSKLRAPGGNTDGVDGKLSAFEQKLEKRLVANAHPDWQQITETEAFGLWVKQQPQTLQADLAQTWDSDVITKALTDFKAAAKAVAEQTEKDRQVQDASQASQAAAEADKARRNTARKEVLTSAIQPRGTSAHAPGSTAQDQFLEGFNSE